jgi:hypothetical protein
MKHLREGIKNNEYIEVEDAGHLSPLDSSETVADQIGKFLDKYVFKL